MTHPTLPPDRTKAWHAELDRANQINRAGGIGHNTRMKSLGLLVLCLSAFGIGASSVHAHIKLLKPTPWVNTDVTGNPQKLGPCGTGSAGSAATNVVTTFQAGEEITVEWNETIDHPGHYRIALAKTRAELKDPDLKPAAGTCDYPAGSVPTAPHGNVLLDNLFPTTDYGGARTFSQKVKLPDEPCEKCTLQLIQWMTKHAPGCIYYQCADIEIVAAGTPAAGSPAAGSGAAGAAGSNTDPAPASDESEGCSVRGQGGARGSAAGLGVLLSLIWLTRRQSFRIRTKL